MSITFTSMGYDDEDTDDGWTPALNLLIKAGCEVHQATDNGIYLRIS